MGDRLSPLYIEPRWDPALVRWLWTFRRFCTERHVDHSMAVIVAPRACRTGDLFDELVDGEESLDCEYRRSGYLEVFDTEEGSRVGLRGGRGRHAASVSLPEYLDGDGAARA